MARGGARPRRSSLATASVRLSARARLERSFRTAVSVDDDTITLRFEWSGGPARLIELRDNETDIYVVSPVGPWVYHAARDVHHVVEWHLFAPDKTLADLRAIASLNGEEEETIASAKSSDGGWIFGGDLR